MAGRRAAVWPPWHVLAPGVIRRLWAHEIPPWKLNIAIVLASSRKMCLVIPGANFELKEADLIASEVT